MGAVAKLASPQVHDLAAGQPQSAVFVAATVYVCKATHYIHNGGLIKRHIPYNSASLSYSNAFRKSILA